VEASVAEEAAEAVVAAAEAAVAAAEAGDNHEEIPIIKARIFKGDGYDHTGNK